MPDSQSRTTDRTCIVRTLTHIARRLRFARVTRELLQGFTLSLILPIALSVFYRFVEMSRAVVFIFLGLWVLGLAGYAFTVLARKETLLDAAGAVDRKADLHDELTTAYWFQQAGRSSSWIALQLHRAASTAANLDVDRLYAWSMPRRARTTGGLLALLLVLNLLPLPWTRGWLEAGPPPVVEFTAADQMLLSEIERMLADAAVAQGTELSPEIRELLAELRQGRLTQDQALSELEKLQTILDSQLDSVEFDELMADIANTLASTNAEALADALSDRDLERAAEELRKLADQMTEVEQEQLQAVLEQMVEQTEGRLEDLAEELASAAEKFAEGDEAEARQAMEELAQELEQIAQQRQGQEMREAAAQSLQQLQQALTEDPNQLQAAQEEMASGDQTAAGTPQSGPPNQDAMSVQVGEAGAQSSEKGQGDLSVPGAGDEIEYGAPTGLEVELLPEIMDLALPTGDEPGDQLIDQPRQAEESKLNYEPVEPTLTYGEADLLDEDTIPLSYRDLVKRYFQVIGPRGQHDH